MSAWLRLAGAVLTAAATDASAHGASVSYVQLDVASAVVEGRWDIALRDLHRVVPLDRDGDGAITWGELRAERALVEQVLARDLQLRADGGACSGAFTDLQVDTHGQETYAVFRLRAQCPRPVNTLAVRYDFLFARDAGHRGLLRLGFGGSHTAVLTPDRREIRFERTSTGFALLQHVREGAFHVWTGYDHLLFLATLLLPAVLWRERGRWVAAASARTVAMEAAVVVTAFTVAHALTLTLVLFGRIDLPARGVESLVAATVAFAALNNLHPLVRGRLWAVAFIFGLIHGAAIASVLGTLDAAPAGRAVALLGFNLGVEGAQLLLVAVWLPVSFALRRTPFYRWGVVTAGSVATFGLAVAWLVERSGIA